MNPPSNLQPTLYRLRFVAANAARGAITFEFSDPASRQAAGEAVVVVSPPLAEEINAHEALHVLVIPPALKDDSRWREGFGMWLGQPDQPEAITIRAGEVHVSWRPGRALIIAPAALVSAALEAVVDFSFFENELRLVEQGIAAAWPTVESDAPLTYRVSNADLARDQDIGQRAQQVLQWRMRHARIEPHLYAPPARFAKVPAQLGEALRESARCEDRAEIADGQIEVQEYIYEMASQRMGEFRHAQQGFIMEAIIVGLLVAEVVLMIVEVCFWWAE